MDHVAQNVKMSNLHNAELRMRLQELRQKIEREEELAQMLESKVLELVFPWNQRVTTLGNIILLMCTFRQCTLNRFLTVQLIEEARKANAQTAALKEKILMKDGEIFSKKNLE